MMAKTGDVAKQFSLKDQHGNNVALKDFAGKKVLLSFHPLVWTNVCANSYLVCS